MRIPTCISSLTMHATYLHVLRIQLCLRFSFCFSWTRLCQSRQVKRKFQETRVKIACLNFNAKTVKLLLFKGHWRRKFLLPISKVPTNVITNMIIVPHQIVWLARYLDFFWLYFQLHNVVLVEPC